MYTPLFGSPLSGRRHHVSGTSALSVSHLPGMKGWEGLTFEVRGHVGWAWSTDVAGGRPDASLLVGARISIDGAEKPRASRGK
ncbi:hypothetical protein A7982_13222 [Minicystis rosea]|nr:hypothetical protein A7982_13222 [Minicystis rosea]